MSSSALRAIQRRGLPCVLNKRTFTGYDTSTSVNSVSGTTSYETTAIKMGLRDNWKDGGTERSGFKLCLRGDVGAVPVPGDVLTFLGVDYEIGEDGVDEVRLGASVLYYACWVGT